MIAPAAALALAGAIGTLTTRLIMRDSGPRSLLVAVTLGMGLGVGMTACAFFVWMALAGPGRSTWFVAAEVHEAHERGRAIARVVAGGTVGAVIGPLAVGPAGSFAERLGADIEEVRKGIGLICPLL